MTDFDMPSISRNERQHRPPLSSDIPPNTIKDRGPNVDGSERIGSGMLGTFLMCWGMGRSGLPRALALAGGALLIGRATTGNCAVKRALQASPYSRQLAHEHGWPSAHVTSAAVTIARPKSEVYRAWRDFSNLPRFLTHVESIDVLTPVRSRWRVKAPMGQEVSWISYVTEDLENERIAWESESGASVPNFGWVEFRDAPGGRGTEVKAMIAFQPPYGDAGRLLGILFQETPPHQMRDNLHRFKQFMETGEFAVSGTQPQGE